MKKLIAILSVLIVCGCVSAHANLKLEPFGIYYLAPGSSTQHPRNPNTWNCWNYPENQHLQGVVARVDWAVLEPSNGVYNWQYLDTIQGLAQAGGFFWEILVQCGDSQYPAWVTAAGAKTVTLHSNSGSPATICQPGDPIFQSAWRTFIAALGARYDSDQNLVIVQMTGVGRAGECFFCSHNSAYLSDWQWLQSQGGAAAWENWAETIAGFYAAAFPTTPFLYSTGAPLPASVDSGNTTMAAVMTNLIATYGVDRIYARSSGYYLGAQPSNWGCNQGYQQNLPSGTGAAAQAQQLCDPSYNAYWFEVYRKDCDLQSNWASFDQFANTSYGY